MKTIPHIVMRAVMAGASAAACSRPVQATLSILNWVAGATRGDGVVEGNGWERVDGSEMHDWFSFYRIGLNGDGLCDWYLNAAAPMSTEGDRESINTLYLGRAAGWTRIWRRRAAG